MSNCVYDTGKCEPIDNQTLIQRTKDIHGELYHRINSLQVQVNRLVEENKKLKEDNRVLRANNAFTSEDIDNLRKTFEHALEYLK